MADREDEPELKEEELDLRDAKVVTKYKAAAEITNAALEHVISILAAGKNIAELCAAGDAFIQDKTSKIFNKGKTEKGVAFPTCVSVNNIAGHFAPPAENKAVLKEGDVVKIDLGTHVDGFAATAAHTVVIGAKPDARAANLIAAAYTAAEAVLRTVKPGNKNTKVTEVIGKVAADFKVTPVQGVLSHQMKRNVIDAEKVILNKADIENKVDEAEFQTNEVYALDIVFSTGDGKPREGDEKPTIYKRNPDVRYNLKLAASKKVFADISKKFASFPFHLRELDSKTAAFGIKECRDHELVTSYPILVEKEDQLVAQFKFTMLLLPSGPVKVTGLPVDLAKLGATEKLKDASLIALLATSGQSKKKKKKNKNKKKGAGGGAAEEEEEDDGEEEN